MNIAVFTGTFDPFTIGHKDIVERGLKMFDRVIVGVVGDNVNKPGMSPSAERVAAIRRVWPEDERVAVEQYDGLAVDFCLKHGAVAIIKGVRSVKDFEYEREMGYVNLQLSGIETILLPARPELSHVSSSLVRELEHFGRDVTALIAAPRSR